LLKNHKPFGYLLTVNIKLLLLLPSLYTSDWVTTKACKKNLAPVNSKGFSMGDGRRDPT